jgi:hypothetical protein
MQNKYRSLTHLKRILRWFKLISGLKVNFHKSSLIGYNLDEDYRTDMVNTIYYKWNTLPIQYLGIPLGANLKRLSTWKLIVN